MKCNKLHPSDKVHTVPVYVSLLFCALVGGLYGLAYLFDSFLPTPLRIEDEKDYPNAFIAERASNDLKTLTNIGPHSTGTYENEVLVVKFLTKEIETILKNASPNKKVEMELQTVSSAKDDAFHKINLQNIVVKLYAENPNSNHSLLVNAHFDSATGSLGGSDDGINCAVMLEILRKLCKSPDQFKHNIIFLFNGAEEVGMLAAHAFIQQHRWFNGTKVFINLEANGAGGQILLFQTGPRQPWLLDYYKKVPYPHASALGEELYQSGVIRTNTDFTIFVLFGDIVGFDFAFMKNGHRYHTKYDAHENIPLGSYQHVGTNTLSLIQSLANAPELEKANANNTDENMVFYDFFSLFLISYTETVGVIINVIISVLSIAVGIMSFFTLKLKGSSTIVYVLLSIAAILLGWILAACLVIATAFVLDKVGYSMSWYGNPWILSGLYVIPTFATSCLTIVLFNSFYKNNKNPSSRAQIQAHCVRIIWAIILLIGTVVLKIRATYLILVPILFQTFTFIIIHIACLQNSTRMWQILYVIGTIIPNLFLMQQAINLVTFLIPQFGRYDTVTNVEMYIGVLSSILTLLISSCYVPLITLVRKSYILIAGFFGVYLIFIVLVFTPLGFPYSGNVDSPAHQRFTSSQHTVKYHNYSGEIYKQEVVYVIHGQDKNAYKTLNFVKDFKAVQHVNSTNICGTEIFWSAVCIPAVEPIFPDSINLQLITKDEIGNSTIRFSFQVLGSNRMDLNITPKPGASLVDSSLPLSKQEVQNETTYSIDYLFGKEEAFIFWLDIKENSQLTGQPLFDVIINKKYPYRKNGTKNEYDELLEQFPNWTNVVSYMSVSESWIY